MFYIINLLVMLSYAYLTNRIKSKKKDDCFLFLSWIQLSMIMGLRKETVGTDSNMYLNLYRIIANGGTTALNTKAPLFTGLIRLTSSIFGGTNQVYFFATGIVTITFVLIAIKEFNIDVRNSVIFFYLMFFLMSLNATRNYMAITMVFAGYAIGVKSEGKLKKILGLIIVIAAMFIHATAIIGIPIYFSSYLDFSKKKTRRVTAIIALVLALGYKLFIGLFTRIFPVYSTTLESIEDQVGASALVFQLSITMCFFQAIYIGRKKLYLRGVLSKNMFYSIMFLVGVEIGMFVIGGSTWYFQRFFPYIEILTIPFFINNTMLKSKYRQIARIGFVTIICFCFVYRIFRNLGSISPYLFFWQ